MNKQLFSSVIGWFTNRGFTCDYKDGGQQALINNAGVGFIVTTDGSTLIALVPFVINEFGIRQFRTLISFDLAEPGSMARLNEFVSQFEKE